MDITETGFVRTPDDAYEQLPKTVQGAIQATCMKHMHDEQKHFVFDPKAKKVTKDGNTITFPTDSPQKVNAYLDDFGSIEALTEELGMPVKTQFRLRLETNN